ncbi:gem-associated protein 2-like [Centruroides vittatus]|uniref:gem-associated protein 2-like n=1 Tax=Centruroides vittatus TaxID=120091 RepID=UPI00350FEA52
MHYVDLCNTLRNILGEWDGSSKSTGCLPAPKGFAPSKYWQQKQIADFSQVRQKLSKYKKNLEEKNIKLKTILPKIDDDIGWCQLCFGGHASNVQPGNIIDDDDNTSISGIDNKLSEKNLKETGVLPSLSIVCAMSQLLIEQVLNYHISWLEVTGFTPHR